MAGVILKARMPSLGDRDRRGLDRQIAIIDL
jgi:hypothetical protein